MQPVYDSGPEGPATRLEKLHLYLDEHPRLMRRLLAVAGVGAIIAFLAVNVTRTPETLLVSAKTHLAENRQAEAVIQLRNALELRPNSGEARFLLGKLLLESGDLAAAAKELNEAFELQYSPDEVVPPLALALVHLGQYNRVIGKLGPVKLGAPGPRAELLALVGWAHLAVGNVDAARNAYQAALATQPNLVSAHLGQARLFANLGDRRAALGAVEKALSISPADRDAFQLKGDIFLEANEVDSALAAYRSAVESRPKFVQGHVAIVALLIRKGELQEAAAQLTRLKELAPVHPKTLYLQALLAHQQKNFSAALTAIQQQLRIAPDNLPGLMLAGAIAIELKSYAQAEVHLSKVLQRRPENVVARRLLVTSYMRNRQSAKAAEALEPMLDRIGGDAAMLAFAGEVYMMNGQPDRAGIYFQKAAAAEPRNMKTRVSVAVSALAQGDHDRALRDLERLAATNSAVQAHLALISAHLRRRSYDEALVSISRFEKSYPETPLPHQLRAAALLGRGDRAGARDSLSRAVAIDPRYTPAVAALAKLDLLDARPEMARERFQTVLASDPRNMDALLGQAAALAATAGQSAPGAGAPAVNGQIVSLLSSAISAHPAEAAPRVALVNYYLKCQDKQRALTAAQAGVAALPARPEILDAAGRAYEAAGLAQQAVLMYEQLAALERTPAPFLKIAEIQFLEGHRNAALTSLLRARAINANSVEVQRQLIRLYLTMNQPREAVSVAWEVRKQRPKEPIGYILEGEIYAKLKKWNDAVDVYRAGLARVASSDLAVRLHDALNAVRTAEAERFADEWLREHRSDRVFRTYMAQFSVTRKEYRAAAYHYRKLLEVDADNASALNDLAWVEAQLRNPVAIEYAERAYKLAPNQPAIMDTLGALLVQKGELERAVRLLQQALSIAPDAPPIRLNLAKALLAAGDRESAKKQLDELAKLGDRFSAQAEVAELRERL